MAYEGDAIRWGLFGAMGVFGTMTIVIGMASQEVGSWKLGYITIYLLWITSAVAFMCLNVKKTEKFVIHSFLYLASIGAVFWFLFHVLNIKSDSIPLYIPICTDLGIFLGVGLHHVSTRCQETVQTYLLATLAFISYATRYDREPPLLPLHAIDPPQRAPQAQVNGEDATGENEQGGGNRRPNVMSSPPHDHGGRA